MDVLKSKMYELTMLVISHLRDVTSLYFSNNYIFILLFFISLVYLCYTSKKGSRRNGYLISYIIIALLVIIYNPFLPSLFYRLPSTNVAVYARLWLVIPSFVIIAYFITEFDSGYKNSIHKIIFRVLVVLLLIVSGNSVSSFGMYNTSYTDYKVCEASVEISDKILELSGNAPVSVLLFSPESEVADNYVNGGTVCEGIRQYTSLIRVIPHTYTQLEWDGYYLSDITLNGRTSTDYISMTMDQWYNDYNLDYVVIPSNEVVISKMNACGYILAGVAGDYYIMRQV